MNGYYRYNLKNNWGNVIGFLIDHCDSFAVRSGSLSLNKFSSIVLEDVLSYEPNSLLRNDFIEYDTANKIGFLKFRISPNSIKWLKLHRSLSDFDETFYEKVFNIDRDKLNRKYIFSDICFYCGEKLLLETETENGYIGIADDDPDFERQFYAILDSAIAKENATITSMIKEWTGLISKGANREEYIDKFVSDKYPISVFLVMFDKHKLYINKWIDFYEKIDTEIVAEIVVKKLKSLGDPVEDIAEVYRWFNFANEKYMDFYASSNKKTKLNYNGILSGANYIARYLLSLSQELFKESFRKALINSEKFVVSLDYLRSIFDVWDAFGLPIEILSIDDITAIKKGWDDVGYYNKDGENIKQGVLLAWFIRRIRFLCRRNSKSDIISDKKLFITKYSEKDRDINYDLELAYAYMYGITYKQSFSHAYAYLRKIANEPNFYDCQFDLARCYLNGWGTEKDIEQAKHWFEVAAMNGHPKAREQLDRIEKAEHNGR